MDLSVIIVSFNTRTLLFNCLSAVFTSLAKGNISFEVIVVDNGSTDGSRVMVQKKFPKVVLVANQENVGFGRANNQGIKKARGDRILLLNSDTEVEEDAILKLLAFSKEHPDCFIGPKLLNPDKTPQTSGGPFMSLPVVFAILLLKGDQLGLTRWWPRRFGFVDWVSGACIMAPAKLFREILFDEGVFMYMEEIDLLMRARKKGYRTMFYPEARVMHVGSGSSTNRRKGPILNIYRGFLYLYKKHYNTSALAVVKALLRFKAVIAIAIGRLTRNKELVDTYEEAYRLV